MVIGFVINSLDTESVNYTTVHLAFQAHKMGHRPVFFGVGDLSYTPDGHMGGRAHETPKKAFKTVASFFNALKKAKPKHVSSAELDVLFLRNDPSLDMSARPWAVHAGILYGAVAAANGVIVLNDPDSLAGATNKMYFQHFPAILRPRTLITRDVGEIRKFFAEQKQKMILKPLQGSGGTNVFKVDAKTIGNLSQIIDAISRDGYVIAQEYLPDAKDGDIRLFVMNGSPLMRDGKYAAFRRVGAEGDIRSNISAGGHPEIVKITDEILQLVEVVRPKLVSDGMFLVGLDIVGDKLMEINVLSPGGLNVVSQMHKVNFLEPVVQALEKKVQYKKLYGSDLNNRDLAIM
jgi:glutathione synthase